MQFSCGRKDTLDVTMLWPSVVTIICYLPFLMWIWGTRHHLIRIISLQTVQTRMALIFLPIILFILGECQGFVKRQLEIFKVWVGQAVDRGNQN